MPIPTIFLHLILSALLVLLAIRLHGRAWYGKGLGALIVVCWLIGFTIQRQPRWEQFATRLPGTGWIFLTNLSLEVVAVLMAVLWCSAQDRKARVRAAFLAPLLVLAAMASYAWYFLPAPADLTGIAESDGLCLQTSHDSCSAAATVTLLARHGIHVTEAQMAALCLTRAGLGTTSLGIYRGLSLAAAPYGLKPRMVHIASLADLKHAPYPCLVSVGLKPGSSPAVQERMISYGWAPGEHHSVVFLRPEASGHRIAVADPTQGRENWPLEDIDPIWNGYGFILVPR